MNNNQYRQIIGEQPEFYPEIAGMIEEYAGGECFLKTNGTKKCWSEHQGCERFCLTEMDQWLLPIFQIISSKTATMQVAPKNDPDNTFVFPFNFDSHTDILVEFADIKNSSINFIFNIDNDFQINLSDYTKDKTIFNNLKIFMLQTINSNTLQIMENNLEWTITFKKSVSSINFKRPNRKNYTNLDQQIIQLWYNIISSIISYIFDNPFGKIDLSIAIDLRSNINITQLRNLGIDIDTDIILTAADLQDFMYTNYSFGIQNVVSLGSLTWEVDEDEYDTELYLNDIDQKLDVTFTAESNFGID